MEKAPLKIKVWFKDMTANVLCYSATATTEVEC